MLISELSAKTNVSVHRLRRYEEAGLISSTRLPNGYRDYPSHTIRYVIFISMSREMGFSLAAIADYLPRFKSGNLSAEEMIQAIRNRISDIEKVIAEQKALKEMLIKHIAWFQTKQRK
jgi:MerR family copper efflux transcriptional regulator